MTSATQNAVLAAVETMQGTLRMAEALARGGRRLDLSGLDREVAALCAASLALPEAEARDMRAGLHGLVRQIEGLDRSLREGTP